MKSNATIPARGATPARLEQLLHADFHEVSRSGTLYDRTTVIRFLGQQAAPPSVVSDDISLARPASGVALLTYRSAQRQPDGGCTHVRCAGIGEAAPAPAQGSRSTAARCEYTVATRRRCLDSGCVSTGGPQMRSLAYSGNSSLITVQVTPNCHGGWGSAWSVELACGPQ